MTRPELRRLDKIIASVERLQKDVDDSLAAGELAKAARDLLSLYGSAKRDCNETEGVTGRGYDPVLGATRRSVRRA